MRSDQGDTSVFSTIRIASLFHFPAEVERLILLPCCYDELLPLARFDLFLDETRASSASSIQTGAARCRAISR